MDGLELNSQSMTNKTSTASNLGYNFP